ncbi:basic secretory protein-like protein [Undibacterium sp. TJN19]|uniref:basic secretory protein-like protein n=1 Tax=Undibacterium sp. TJN19 TaxID=3413055 RepID=UPI003BF016F9
MKNRFVHRFIFCFALILSFFITLPALADEAPAKPVTEAEFKPTPEIMAQMQQSQQLLSEWYPRINSILYGDEHALPYENIKIVLMPGFAVGMENVIAYASGNTIYVAADKANAMTDSFQAMMIHELTHINQHYPASTQTAVWVMEGIADYVRHKYFEKDISATLKMNSDAQLMGYQSDAPYFYLLEQQKISLLNQGYLRAYTVASTFFYWLETRRDKDIVRKLNLALSKGEYTPALFAQYCGAPLDEVWQDFINESRNASTVK